MLNATTLTGKPVPLKLVIASLVALLLNGCATKQVSVSPKCAHTETTFQCVEFVHNYDGDTVTVNIPDVPPLIGKNISVRVLGIDAPEIKGKTDCEKKAAQKAKSLVATALENAKSISLTNIQRDKYFRILADVQYDGKYLSKVLLDSHLAVPYYGGTKEKIDWCQHLSE